jgi:DNA-binding LacI/PurR family transcriptional regulator
LTKAYWGEVADSVERRASELGVSVVLGTSRTCFRPKESVLDLFVRSRVEGVIVAGFEGSPVQWAAARMGRVRLVLVEWDAWFDGSFSDEAKKLRDAADEPEEAFMSPSSEVSYLAYNELDAGRTVASHLLDLDHRAVTFVGPPTRTSLLFYCGALSAYELRGELVPYPCADGPDAGREAGTTILRGANPPTAIIAATDEIASGVMRAARELGVHVPGDLSVTGHDDIGVAEFLHPRLTTFRTPRDEIGRLAVESALGVRRAASPAQRLLGTLTVRESTGPTRRVR